MQARNPEVGKTQRNQISRQHILDCFESKHIKVVDLTDVLAKFPEIFSISISEPECKNPSALDPNDALVTPSNNPHITKNGFTATSTTPKLVIPRSPFSKSGFAEDLTARAWYYLDEQDRTQGPFTSIEMDNWYESGYFFNELLVRFKSNQFYKLIELFGKFPTSAPTNNSMSGPILRAGQKVEKEAQSGTAEKRGSGTQEDLGKLKHGQSVRRESFEQTGAHTQQKGGKRGSKRMSVEEAPSMLQKNIWENFVEKNKNSDPKPEAASSKDSRKSTPETDTKTQVELKADEAKTESKEQVQNKSEPKQKTHQEDVKKGGSDLTAGKKKKNNNKRRQSDSDSGESSDKTKEEKRTQKGNNRRSKEYIEYRPKDESKLVEKTEQEGSFKGTKNSPKDKEPKQKEMKPEGKAQAKNSGQDQKDGGSRRNSNKESQNGKGRNGQDQQNEQRPQQNRNQKKQGKYVVVFEPKAVSIEAVKFSEKSAVEEKKSHTLSVQQDNKAKSDSATQDKSVRLDGDGLSDLSPADLMAIGQKYLEDDGNFFLPKPVIHSRFDKLFKANTGLQAAQ